MSLATIRDGLKARCATIDGLNTYDLWPGRIDAPACIVKPGRKGGRQTLGNSGGARPVVMEIVLAAAAIQRGGLDLAQDALDAYLDESGATSIEAAIEADKTLSGAATTLSYLGWRDYGSLEINGAEYLGVVFDVEVWP